VKAHAAKFRDSARMMVLLPAISLALSAFPSMAVAQDAKPSTFTPTFKGVIDLDIRKSTPDWAPYLPKRAPEGAPNVLFILYERIVLTPAKLLVTLKTSDATGNLIELARSNPPASPRARIETDNCQLDGEPDINLIHALARAHLWLITLYDGTYQSIEELASVAKWNPKVIRKVLRLAFLAPNITEAIIFGSQPKSLSLSGRQGISAQSWDEQRRLLLSMSPHNVHYGIFWEIKPVRRGS
jgi:hypothetical protein